MPNRNNAAKTMRTANIKPNTVQSAVETASLWNKQRKINYQTGCGQNPLTVVNRSNSKITVEMDDGKKFVHNPIRLQKLMDTNTMLTGLKSQPEPEQPPGPVATTT